MAIVQEETLASLEGGVELGGEAGHVGGHVVEEVRADLVVVGHLQGGKPCSGRQRRVRGMRQGWGSRLLVEQRIQPRSRSREGQLAGTTFSSRFSLTLRALTTLAASHHTLHCHWASCPSALWLCRAGSGFPEPRQNPPLNKGALGLSGFGSSVLT